MSMRPLDADEAKSSLDHLFDQIGIYHNVRDLKEVLKFVKRFPAMKPFNAFLLQIQKPGAIYVASDREWKDRWHRFVKPGVRPLIILKPFGPVDFVYDLSDTEGDEPLLAEVFDPFEAQGSINPQAFYRLMENLPKIGIYTYETSTARQLAGYVELLDRACMVQAHEREYECWFGLGLSNSLGRNEAFATVCHEIAHVLCGHLGGPYLDFIHTRTNLSMESREFEAECVTWIVCTRQGLDPGSYRYLDGYMNHNRQLPHFDFNIVLRVAGTIESMLKPKFSWTRKHFGGME